MFVVGTKVQRFLEVALLKSGTIDEIADAVVEYSKPNLRLNVVGMCFDLTIIDTGGKNGAFLIIQRAVDRNIFRFACWCQSFKFPSKEVFIVAMQIDAKGPEVLLLKNFLNDTWSKIYNDQYKSCLQDLEIPPKVFPDDSQTY